jgi:hypothetical protein
MAASDARAPGDATPQRSTPALLEDGELEDVKRLSRSHVSELSDPPVRMRATFRGPRHLTGFDTRRSGFDADDEVTVRIGVAEPDRYRIIRQTSFSGSELTATNTTLERFADGTAEYRRIDREGDVGYERRPLSTVRGGTGAVLDWSRFLVTRYPNTSDRRLEVSRRGSAIRYRVVATGDPFGLDHETRDYRAVAVVEPAGWIRALRVSYVHPRTGARVVETAGFDREQASSTTRSGSCRSLSRPVPGTHWTSTRANCSPTTAGLPGERCGSSRHKRDRCGLAGRPGTCRPAGHWTVPTPTVDCNRPAAQPRCSGSRGWISIRTRRSTGPRHDKPNPDGDRTAHR